MIRELTENELGETSGGQAGTLIRLGREVLVGILVDGGKQVVKSTYSAARERANNLPTYTDSQYDAMRGVGPSAHSDAIRGPSR